MQTVDENAFVPEVRFIPVLIVGILRLIPTALKVGQRSVKLSKFTIRTAGKLKEPKSGWTIARDKGGANAHGGSTYKLFNRKGDRIATLDKNGKILRK